MVDDEAFDSQSGGSSDHLVRRVIDFESIMMGRREFDWERAVWGEMEGLLEQRVGIEIGF